MIDAHTRGFKEKAYDENAGFERAVDMNMILNTVFDYEDFFEKLNLTPSQVEQIAEKMKRGELREVVPCGECILNGTKKCKVCYDANGLGGPWAWQTKDTSCSYGQRKEDDDAED